MLPGAALPLPECFGVDFYKHEEIQISRHDSTLKGVSQVAELLHLIHSVPPHLSLSIFFFLIHSISPLLSIKCAIILETYCIYGRMNIIFLT